MAAAPEATPPPVPEPRPIRTTEEASRPEAPESAVPSAAGPRRKPKRPGGRPRIVDWCRPLTVRSVAEVLHVAPTTVRNLVQRGVLHPLDGPPPLKFSRDEVLRVAALSGVEVKTIPTDGEVAAAAFASFRAGRSVRDVVIEHKIPPDHAELLLQRYCAMGGDMVFPGEVVRKIQALGFFQNRALDPHELPMLLQDLLSYYEQAGPDARIDREPPHEPPSS